jgi:hypothetical protein
LAGGRRLVCRQRSPRGIPNLLPDFPAAFIFACIYCAAPNQKQGGFSTVVRHVHRTASKLPVIAGLASFLTLLALALLPDNALALPLFARQTGYDCDQCHTIFLGLTPFGRRFKLNGYVMTGGDSDLPPLAMMIQAGYTRTASSQPGGAAPHYAANDNFSVQQTSLFTGGRITDNVGAFIQYTYDGVADVFHWDNSDVRYTYLGSLAGYDVTYGVTLNNSPSVQDVWNTTPAWGFPYISSELVPTPAASPLIDSLAQQVVGLGA